MDMPSLGMCMWHYLETCVLISIVPSAVNAFVEYRVPVKEYLEVGENEIQIVFPSSFFKGLELEEKNGKKMAWNGNTSRLHIRKPQYQ